MSCLNYASHCVFPSSERLVLYNQVFNLHREELDEDEQVERSLLGKVPTINLWLTNRECEMCNVFPVIYLMLFSYELIEGKKNLRADVP